MSTQKLFNQTALILALFLLVLQQVQPTPVSIQPADSKLLLKDDITPESNEENKDLNLEKTDPLGLLDSKETTKFRHHDEDQDVNAEDFDSDEESAEDDELSPKSDAEELETRDDKRPTVELEEQYRGSALKFNTNTFSDEEIEVTAVRTSSENAEEQQSHIYISVILVTLALVSIGLYVALVLWRSHLEQRYGMRELLVNQDDDECNSPYNPTTIPHPQQFTVISHNQSQA